MKGKISKLLSMLLASVMVLSMAMTGLAAEIEPLSSDTDTEFTITVTGAANGETYTAYKIFDVSYDNYKHYTYSIDANSAWYAVVSEATDVFELESSDGIYIVTVKEGVADDDIIAVFTDAGVPEGTTAAGTAVASGGEAVIDVTNSGPGYYYVTTSLGSLVFLDTTDPAAEIEEKNGTPTLSKWVHENTDPDDTWGHEDDASNKSEIMFEIEIDNINGATNLVLHDSMDSELEIPDASNFHMSSVTLYASEDAEGILLTEGTDYTVSVGECTVEGCTLPSNCAFEINFTDYDFSDVDATGYIEVIYELLLNVEDLDILDSDAYAKIENEAQVSFGTTSFSTVVYADTYSFGFMIYKYEGDNVYGTSYSGPHNGMVGVGFELRDEDGNTAYFLLEDAVGNNNGKKDYVFEGWLAEGEEAPEGYETTLTPIDTYMHYGMIYIEGLDTGTYYLYETYAPEGYNILTEPVIITITATYDDETGEIVSCQITYTYGDNTYTAAGRDADRIDIRNGTGNLLPGTGGMGTTIFYIVGIVLVLGAVVLFVTKKRLDRKQ